jgi:predicted dehydrogenase
MANRRTFIRRSAVTATGVLTGVPSLLTGRARTRARAPETIRVGFIGVGNRGTQLLGNFMENEDVEIAALCDVYEPYVNRDESAVHPRYLAAGKTPRMQENFGSGVKRFADYRRLLDDPDIDAVVIATPDHWHALQAIHAMEAGKDVYVEKPLTITIREGRAIVDAQHRTGRVCAVGLNRRGSSVYRQLSEKVPEGLIGPVTSAQAFRISNMYPDGIGRLQPEAPPADFDWDLWLGPRAMRPYQYNIAPYFFRWWKDYSSQMGNWGVHYMDVIRWMMDQRAPLAVSARGGKYAVRDDRTIPDTMEVLFEMPAGAVIKFSIHEASSGPGIQGGEVLLNGAKGSLVASQNGYRVTPARPGQFQTWTDPVEAIDYELKNDSAYGDLGIRENSTARLIRNFLDCVKTRDEPWCTAEEGHRSTCFAHLANIALERGGRLEWDAERELITNDERANELLHYDYRQPWSLPS